MLGAIDFQHARSLPTPGKMLLYPLFLALLLVVGLASAKPPTHRPPFIKRYSKYYRKTATSRGYDYNFLAIKPDAQKQKPILVFLHGFPSHSHDWHNQIEYFHSEGKIQRSST